jgi:hypothetical protein
MGAWCLSLNRRMVDLEAVSPNTLKKEEEFARPAPWS